MREPVALEKQSTRDPDKRVNGTRQADDGFRTLGSSGKLAE
jgi:hypothetical protein